MQVTRVERILVCWDSAGKDILSLTGRLAAASNARVRLMACMPEPPAYRSIAVPNYAELADLAREALEGQMHRAVRRLSTRGVEADGVIARCAADDALLGELQSQSYDVVIVAAQKHGTEYTAGRSTIHLMRRAPCPVWVVRPGHLGTRPRMVVCVAGDGPEDLNVRLLCTANELATHLGGELHVLSVWNAVGASMLRGHPFVPLNADDVRRYVLESREACTRALRKLLLSCDSRIDHRRLHLIKGDPRLVIPEFCTEHGIPVLVMGTVARTGLIGALLGNTAEKISRSLPASIVSVRPACVAIPGGEPVELTATAQGVGK